jgi:hypothetical protein
MGTLGIAQQPEYGTIHAGQDLLESEHYLNAGLIRLELAEQEIEAGVTLD